MDVMSLSSDVGLGSVVGTDVEDSSTPVDWNFGVGDDFSLPSTVGSPPPSPVRLGGSLMGRLVPRASPVACPPTLALPPVVDPTKSFDVMYVVRVAPVLTVGGARLDRPVPLYCVGDCCCLGNLLEQVPTTCRPVYVYSVDRARVAAVEKLYQKCTAAHAGKGPCSKPTRPRGPASRHEVGAVPGDGLSTHAYVCRVRFSAPAPANTVAGGLASRVDQDVSFLAFHHFDGHALVDERVGAFVWYSHDNPRSPFKTPL